MTTNKNLWIKKVDGFGKWTSSENLEIRKIAQFLKLKIRGIGEFGKSTDTDNNIHIECPENDWATGNRRFGI